MRRSDYRLRDSLQRSGDLPIATELGVPRSRGRGSGLARVDRVKARRIPERTDSDVHPDDGPAEIAGRLVSAGLAVSVRRSGEPAMRRNLES